MRFNHVHFTCEGFSMVRKRGLVSAFPVLRKMLGCVDALFCARCNPGSGMVTFRCLLPRACALHVCYCRSILYMNNVHE